MTFFRYPGGKAKLKQIVVSKLHEGLDTHSNIEEYREPFFGGGKIGTEFLSSTLKKFWINDFDLGISCLWSSVLNDHTKLIDLIKSFVPTTDAFYNFKKDLLVDKDLNLLSREEKLNIGFKKLVVHQTSFSGLGTKSGGPLGGKKQLSKYKIDCRWSPKYLSQKILKLNSSFKNKVIRQDCCTSLDFSEVISDNSTKALLYLDPPYFDKGNELYQCGFTYEDHTRLAKDLSNCTNLWVLSYDNCEDIIDLYKDWTNIVIISDINYSINTARKYKTELLISNF